MKIDKTLILKLEELSRLQLSEEERNTMITNLSDMLKMVEKLEELPTQDIEPLVYINSSVNIWREDEASEVISTEMALSNAPDANENFFNVPRVINLNKK